MLESKGASGRAPRLLVERENARVRERGREREFKGVNPALILDPKPHTQIHTHIHTGAAVTRAGAS